MSYDPATIIRILAMLALLGAAFLVATRVVTKVAARVPV